MGLTPLEVKHAKDGVLFDGEGLYLRVSGGGTRKSWVLRFTFHGKRIDLGLGSAKLLSLSEARDEARRLRKMALLGKDPRLDPRFVQPVEAPAASAPGAQPAEPVAPAEPVEAGEEATGMTFAQAVDAYLEVKLSEFKNAKHVQQWQHTLRDYACAPKAKGIKGLGNMDVAAITKHDVLRVLKPIWTTKTETASRVRGRIEAVLKWAAVSGHRTGENPAAWKDNLEMLLPMASKVKTVAHHEALPYQDLPAFMADLSGLDTVPSLALQWLILTGVRSTEGREAQWSEVDLDAGVWTVPAARMKMKVAHRVPLSAQALDLARRVKGLNAKYLFSATGKLPVSEAGVRKLVKETLKKPDLTLHGFRTTLRTWMQDNRTDFEVAETILAHKVGSDVSQAYARGDYLERRRPVMQAYADYAYSKSKK